MLWGTTPLPADIARLAELDAAGLAAHRRELVERRRADPGAPPVVLDDWAALRAIEIRRTIDDLEEAGRRCRSLRGRGRLRRRRRSPRAGHAARRIRPARCRRVRRRNDRRQAACRQGPDVVRAGPACKSSRHRRPARSAPRPRAGSPRRDVVDRRPLGQPGPDRLRGPRTVSSPRPSGPLAPAGASP